MPEDQTVKTHTGVHHGPILAVIIIMLVLILGGLILWGRELTKEQVLREQGYPSINNEPETPRAIVDAEILDTTSPSDELSAIKIDLESTNLDVYGTELQTMDAELEMQ